MKKDNLYESKEYINSYHTVPGKRIRHVLKKIDCSKDDIVVDYACGSGLLAQALYNRYKEYYGIDTSRAFIKKANKLVKERQMKNTFFFCQDIIDFSQNNTNKFSKAFTLDFSEHIDDETFIHIYSAIRESLQDNGMLILHTPNKNFLLEKLKLKGLFPQTNGHIAIRNFDEYKNLLEECSYKNINITYLRHYKNILNLIPSSSKSRILITCTR